MGVQAVPDSDGRVEKAVAGARNGKGGIIWEITKLIRTVPSLAQIHRSDN